MYIKLIFRYTSKGAFTYYIITDGEGVSKMLMHDYGGMMGMLVYIGGQGG